eukprot:CAMPEP_0117589966 /NCGR_PEP_ID=MMETSP0784-20121206/70711_1 /TAXON_ID=39447 /ORGANISM="" /LENGTH=328 /DNA_ID=CAMNT_0005391517 /DNA_START=79 /DNA_END=1065 /DNA_ORIENTATION=+
MAVLARVLCALVCGGCLCAQAGATLAQRPSSRRSLRSSEAAVTTASSQISKACDATPDPRSRVMLMMVVAAYHGSTSAEQLLMSSSNVATLAARCRGSARASVSRSSGGSPPGGGKPPKTLGSREVEEFDFKYWDINFELSRFATYWDLRRPVLLEKTPERMQGNFLEQELSALLTAPMPDLMKKKAAQPFRYVLGLAAARPPREDARKDAGKFSGAGAQCVTDGSHAGPDEEERQLSRFATYWDLRRPVLLEKTPERMQGNFLEQELSALLTAPMPDLMKKKAAQPFRYVLGLAAARPPREDFARSIDPKSCCEYDVAQRRCGRSTD